MKKYYVQANCVEFITLTEAFGVLQDAIDWAMRLNHPKWEPRIVDEEGEIVWNWE